MNLASRGSDSRLRIIVLGYIVRCPLGGMTWHHLQYVMGLARLGHEVYFIEDSDDTPFCCYDPTQHITAADPAFGLRYINDVFMSVGLDDYWAYYDAHTGRWFGPRADDILDICGTADLLMNLSCSNPLRPWLLDIPVRVLIETDPAFTQIRNLHDPNRRDRSALHTVFFSFGENIAESHSLIPKDEFLWLPTRQPMVLDAWPVTQGSMDAKLTTVMQWDSYLSLEHDGRYYGMKSESFTPYMELPMRTGPIFELALGGTAVPRDRLRSKGWVIRNPLELSRTPWTYQRYIRQSKAEFTVAKHGYVVCRSGWFSERSAAYLASGRPVITQETGFSDWLETGAGVFSFNTPDEVLAGIDAINSRYAFHCRAARDIAAEYFDARKVLLRLLESAVQPASRLATGEVAGLNDHKALQDGDRSGPQ